ncbi:MAG: PAS domain S-box protein [Desulfobacterales bacterium]|nr:PAS domain S-box protein [Desulfobacterales bacterium]
MKLRTILLVLSLLAFLSASLGGYLYYSALREADKKRADRRVVTRVELIRKNLSARLSQNIRPVRALSRMNELLGMLVRPGPEALDQANAVLDLFKESMDADVCYLINHRGVTVASSNRNAPDSFIGKNYAFRPYFQMAMHSAPSTYLALGVTSRKRGAYFSFPIFESGEDTPIGLAVIKSSIDQIEMEMGFSDNETVLVADPHGIIFISNRKDWLFRSIQPLSAEQRAKIARSRQFGGGPWEWAGLRFSDSASANDDSGNQYVVHQAEIDNYPGWRLIHLQNKGTAAGQFMSDPLLKMIGPIVLTLCFLVGFFVMMLYRKASRELYQRRMAEKALRESETRYRSLYHHTPAMLHSIDPEGRLLSVSDYWVEIMGYERHEAIGRKLTDFFTEDSRRFAQDKVFPAFFQTGFCKEVPYRFVKKNGDIVDVLLSAITDRDAAGSIVRTLAVSIDVTERKKAEEALRKAKETLSRYSKDLEGQVRKRTQEISSILRYTPAVVYIKDRRGRYSLVNSRFVELFHLSGQDVMGRTDEELLPASVAGQFQKNDRQVLEEGRSLQVQEQIVQEDGVHTYLSVKFPIYDENGAPIGVCGIATDVTAVKKAQDQLRRLSAGIMASQEKERTAIARELHDELGQVLTALRMDSVWMRKHLKEADPEGAQRALTMCDLIDKTIEEVRGIAIRLRPGVLDTLGLVDALDWYAGDFERRTEISCTFEPIDVPAVTDSLATAAYRIAQEALTNVARHAGASRVHLSLAAENGKLLLSVADDGGGFDTAVLNETEALGVAGMRERASLVGGSIEVASRIGVGTRVEFRVPLKGHLP